MTDIKEIYRCNICGNIVEVVNKGPGQLVCCGEKMELLKAETKETGSEKHVPIIEKIENGVRVKVGAVEHPMADNHYITWIELIADGYVYRKHLKPGDKPEAVFHITGENLSCREYCSVHGLWKSQ